MSAAVGESVATIEHGRVPVSPLNPCFVECQGHAIAGTGCRALLPLSMLYVATLPDWRRAPVCLDCLLAHGGPTVRAA